MNAVLLTMRKMTCDKHGFVLDFEVGAGNLHDGLLFHELYKKMDLSRTQVVAVDAGYKWIYNIKVDTKKEI